MKKWRIQTELAQHLVRCSPLQTYVVTGESEEIPFIATDIVLALHEAGVDVAVFEVRESVLAEHVKGGG